MDSSSLYGRCMDSPMTMLGSNCTYGLIMETVRAMDGQPGVRYVLTVVAFGISARSLKLRRKRKRAKALQGPFLGVGMTAVRKREHRNEYISVLLLFLRLFPITIRLRWEHRHKNLSWHLIGLVPRWWPTSPRYGKVRPLNPHPFTSCERKMQTTTLQYHISFIPSACCERFLC